MADPITWYALGRNVSDNQSIIEEMQAELLAHNQDVSAHGQSSEAVYNHRIAEIMDHLEGSVDWKHLTDKKMVFHSAFDTRDGWSVLAEFTNTILCMGIHSTFNGYAFRMGFPNFANPIKLNPAKNPFFQTTVNVYKNVTQFFYFGAGRNPLASVQDSFGFYIGGTDLSAYYTNGGNLYNYAIPAINTLEQNVYRAYIDSTLGKVSYFVNGTLVYESSSNIPTTPNDFFFEYYGHKAVIGNDPLLVASDIVFEQDR